MHSALIDHGEEIEARDFAALSDEQREDYRGRLTCPDRACSAPAYFRRKSKDGKPALFFSTCHVEGCSQSSTSEAPVVIDGDPVETSAVWNDADNLVLRFDDGPQGRSSFEVHEAAHASTRGRRHSSEHGEKRTSTSSTSLRPLLRRLRDDPTFRASARTLDIGHGVRGPISALCAEAVDLAAVRGDRLVIWGSVYSAQGEWIDCLPKTEQGFGVRVPRRLHEDVATRNGLASWTEVASPDYDFSFIVVGVVRENSNGALYVTVEDPHHVALLRS